MPTPSLRILIVESEHLQRLAIEKAFNKYGYHCIAPLSSFKELQAIIDHVIKPFDVVVINAALVREVEICLESFCRQCPCILNALIYEGRPEFIDVSDEPKTTGVFKRLPGVPDTKIIESLILRIDPLQKKTARRYSFRRGGL